MYFSGQELDDDTITNTNLAYNLLFNLNGKIRLGHSNGMRAETSVTSENGISLTEYKSYLFRKNIVAESVNFFKETLFIILLVSLLFEDKNTYI